MQKFGISDQLYSCAKSTWSRILFFLLAATSILMLNGKYHGFAHFLGHETFTGRIEAPWSFWTLSFDVSSRSMFPTSSPSKCYGDPNFDRFATIGFRIFHLTVYQKIQPGNVEDFGVRWGSVPTIPTGIRPLRWMDKCWMWPVSWANTLGANWLSWPSPERMPRRSSICALE